MSLTPEQQAAVNARGKIIVSASAGSGKTFVMIERLFALMKAGASIKNVLCVTFTNKAAAQMRDRLRRKLLEEIGKSENAAVRKHLKEQLGDLSAADICTLHAFCGRLVRSRFYLVGVDPAFRIISPDDKDGKAISAAALSETFERAYESMTEGFKELLGIWYGKRDTKLRELVKTVYKKVCGTLDVERVLNEIGQRDDFAAAEEFLLNDYQRSAKKIADAVEAQKSTFSGNAHATKVCDDILAACDTLCGMNTLYGAVALEKPNIKSMPNMKKAEGEELRRLSRLKECSEAIKDIYKELRTAYAAEEVEHERCESARRQTAAFAVLLKDYREIYDRIKREKTVLDYDDLERYTLEILSHADELAELKQKYRYLFVDEYQDVNPVQEKFISLLSGEEVFLVGDEKQAIYGFRGSCSELFLEKTREYETLDLTKNFRSTKEVLGAVNRVFLPLVEGYKPMEGGDGFGDFSGSVSYYRLPERVEEEKERGIYSVKKGAKGEPADVLSEQVVGLIEREMKNTVYGKDGERQTEYGDIAVLVRKHEGDAERIARLCVERGIPVSTTSETNICDYFEVRLILDFLSLLDNAEQDIPLGTALLSGIGRMTEEELAKIRLRFPSPYTFREACAQYQKNMADGLSQKLKAFYAEFERLRVFSRARSAADVANTLLSKGLEKQILEKGNGRARLGRVRRLVAEAGTDSVHAFLRRLKTSGDRIDYSEGGGENAVQILTMHAAKGLEYPVVILTGMDALFHSYAKDDFLWTDRFLLTFRSYDTLNKRVYDTLVRRAAIRSSEREREGDERNLLYVAMTRAECRLHVFFKPKAEKFRIKRGCFADFFDFSASGDEFSELHAILPVPLERNAFSYRPNAELAKEIRAVWDEKYAYGSVTGLPVKSSATDLINSGLFEEEEKREYPVGGFDTQTGLAYHKFLEHVEFGKNAREELARMREAGLFCEDELAILNEEKLEQILSIPCLNALAGKRVWREQNFLMALPACEIWDGATDDEIVFQGAIDLLVEDEEGYTVVDYKFSGRSDGALKAHYGVQIKLYRKAVARAFGVDEGTVRARIVNLAAGREIEL